MRIQEKSVENAFTTTETILLSCSTALVYGTVVRLELRLEHLGFFSVVRWKYRPFTKPSIKSVYLTNSYLYFCLFLKILWSEVCKKGFQLMLIMGLLGMYFNAAMVFVTTFHFYSDWLWPYCELKQSKFLRNIGTQLNPYPAWISTKYIHYYVANT